MQNFPEPMSPASETWSLNHQNTREFLTSILRRGRDPHKHSERGHRKMEAEVGVMQSHSNGHLETPDAG